MGDIWTWWIELDWYSWLATLTLMTKVDLFVGWLFIASGELTMHTLLRMLNHDMPCRSNIDMPCRSNMRNIFQVACWHSIWPCNRLLCDSGDLFKDQFLFFHFFTGHNVWSDSSELFLSHFDFLLNLFLTVPLATMWFRWPTPICQFQSFTRHLTRIWVFLVAENTTLNRFSVISSSWKLIAQVLPIWNVTFCLFGYTLYYTMHLRFAQNVQRDRPPFEGHVFKE